MSETVEQRISSLEKKLENIQNQRKDQLSMVVFSGDLDKILAALVIAVGAAAMDTDSVAAASPDRRRWGSSCISIGRGTSPKCGVRGWAFPVWRAIP